MKTGRPIKNIAGSRWGLLTAEKFSHVENKNAHWFFRCDCGGGIVRPYGNVKLAQLLGRTSNCGCIAFEIASVAHTVHGYSRHPLYKTWCHMLDRCYNPRNPAFKNYGGRGIDVDDLWRYSFEKFAEDVGEGGPGLTLDRVDNDRGYGPDNFRWATATMQANNKRTNLPFDVKAVALAAGVTPDAIYARLKKGLPLTMQNQKPRRDA